MELIGYIGAALIGTSLGLIGAGGSILTVSLMVYLFHVPALLATSYSLAIVGFSSLLGAVAKYKQREICIKTALLFGIISITVVAIIRWFVIPVIPHELVVGNGIHMESSTISMILFSVLMIAAAYFMIRNKRKTEESVKSSPPGLLRLVSSGIAVGLVTGLLGAGGGFLLLNHLRLICITIPPPLLSTIGMVSVFLIVTVCFSRWFGLPAFFASE